MVNWKMCIPSQMFSRILLIDTEQLSKIWFSVKVFFKEMLIDSELPTLNLEFFEGIFQTKALLIDSRIATCLKKRSSEKHYWRILFIDFKTAIKILKKFSFHHKWNEASLLVISWFIRVSSRVAEWLNTFFFPVLQILETIRTLTQF